VGKGALRDGKAGLALPGHCVSGKADHSTFDAKSVSEHPGESPLRPSRDFAPEQLHREAIIGPVLLQTPESRYDSSRCVCEHPLGFESGLVSIRTIA